MADHVYEFQQISEYAVSTANEVMNSVLEAKRFTSNKTGEWVDAIGSGIISQLKEACQNFKYVVSCVIVQKTGSGLHSEIVSHWDASTDGAVCIKFENDTIVCICTIIGIAL